MAVHVDDVDGNCALIVQIVAATAAQRQVSVGRVDGPEKRVVARERNARIVWQAKVSEGTAVATVVDGADGGIRSGNVKLQTCPWRDGQAGVAVHVEITSHVHTRRAGNQDLITGFEIRAGPAHIIVVSQYPGVIDPPIGSA